ncbi:MAG: peptidylprolyl isomerase [Sphingobacteriales bacterium]|nr:MAG: peptidylprolyl isomerase [Sphingobacteriales bacterium]
MKYYLVSILLLTSACAPKVSLLHPEKPAFRKAAPGIFSVALETTKGLIELEVHRDWSPHGADRFYNLVQNGYYNNAAVFRIRPGVWAQFGIAEDPAVSRAWRQQTLPDEPRMISNERGSVAYAFKDPNGRTTQMFINLRDNSATHDTEPFVPFAKVVKGMEIADELYSGYGEQSGGGIRAGKQDSLFARGNAYLKQYWPKLDYIVKARIIK